MGRVGGRPRQYLEGNQQEGGESMRVGIKLKTSVEAKAKVKAKIEVIKKDQPRHYTRLVFELKLKLFLSRL